VLCDQNVVENGTLKIIIVRDQLPVFRVGGDLKEDRRRRISRQPQLRLLVVNGIGQAQRLRRRIDRINVGAAVAQLTAERVSRSQTTSRMMITPQDAEG
jgi:hypothetical protein